MEEQFFTWTDVDRVDDNALIFYGLTFKQALGPYTVDVLYPDVNACIDYNNGTLEIYAPDGQTVVYRAKLKLKIDTVEVEGAKAPDVSSLDIQ